MRFTGSRETGRLCVVCQKVSQSSRPQTRKIQIIFHRHLCVGKKILSGSKFRAQQTAISLAEKSKIFAKGFYFPRRV